MTTWQEVRKKAGSPGSSVLSSWKAQRVQTGAWRDGTVAQPQASSSTLWGGISWDEWVRGNFSTPAVNEKTARTVAAVHACVELIGNSIASLPLHFYRRGQDGAREKYTPDAWWLFNERASFNWSAAAMWKYISDARLFHGDGFVWIHRKGRYSPDIQGLEPLHPQNVDVLKVNGELKYRVRGDNGQVIDTVNQDDMLHFPGPGFDGMRSMSALRYGLLKAGGIALAADDQAQQFMADGVRADFAIETPSSMTPEAQETLRRTFLDRHSGTGSKRAPIVLAGGLKLHQLTMSMEDAQLLTTRAFQIEEICRIFGVPPFMIGHTEKTTSWGTGVEQMGIGFVKYTLTPHLTVIEQEINHKLFKTARAFCEFVTAALERGDIKTRYEAYRVAVGRAGEPGWMHPNEIRALENLPPLPGGDTLNTGATNAPAQQTVAG